jgi:hypothetical protein
MPEDKIILYLSITDPLADPEYLDELSRLLMSELRDLGADSVETLQESDPQKGAKGDPFTIGALLVVALPALLPNLVSFLQAWSLRGENRRVRIKTPVGVEVEFTPEKRLSQKELLDLVNELSKIPPSAPSPAPKA